MQRVLVVDDERDVADLIGSNLERAGYEVLRAYDGCAGEALVYAAKPDLVVLDLMLRDKDGLEMVRCLRGDERSRDLAVIALAARTEIDGRIEGLEAGADDCMSKPFSIRELLLRVAAVLRRRKAGIGGVEVERGPFRFNKNALQFFLDRQPVELTVTEFKLLLYLTERSGKTQKRGVLLSTIWGYEEETRSRTLDTHVERLRHKLGTRAPLLETVRGVGYRLRAA